MTNAAERDGHAADAGVIVGQRAQGGPDEPYEVGMVWEEGVLPERSERFSARAIMTIISLLFQNYGNPHLYNLIPYQRRAQHAGQCGVEVEGGTVPTCDWFLNVQILTSGGFR